MPSPRADYEQQRTQIEQELKETAPGPLRSRISRLIQPAITLSTSPPVEELPFLASKLGGSPDVPLGFEWPHFDGQPLIFIAQINLEELAPFDLENHLPRSGLLSFWTNGSWGFAKEFGSWRVFHFQSQHWQKLEKPAPEGFWKRWINKDFRTFRCAPVQPEVWASLPDVWGGMEFRDEQLQPHFAESLFASLGGNYGHQMFGFANNIQNDVREDCAFQWNAFLALPEANRLGLSASHDQATWQDFELLLQIQEDENARMVWGDGGAIYFLIRKSDLKAKCFNRCWFILQSG